MTVKRENFFANGKAMIIGCLVALGFLTMFASLGGAVAITYFPTLDASSKLPVIPIIIATVIILSGAFFIAGYFSSRISRVSGRFDTVVQSLGAWALMAILVVIVASSLMVLNAVRNLKAPVLITNVHISKPNIVTKVGPEAEHSPKEEKRTEKIDGSLWWAAFLSLSCGGVFAVFGGFIARNQVLKAYSPPTSI